MLVVITGPSGVGKDTIKEAFLKRNLDFQRIVTDTSREPRNGEINGVHHNFFTSKQFLQRIKKRKYLEYIEARADEYKGTSKDALKPVLSGQNIFWQVDEYAMAHLKEILWSNMPEVADDILEKKVTVYIAPEDEIQLREQYFCRDSDACEEKFAKKLARDKELYEQYHDRYMFTVVNKRGKIGETVNEIEKIVAQKREEFARK